MKNMSGLFSTHSPNCVVSATSAATSLTKPQKVVQLASSTTQAANLDTQDNSNQCRKVANQLAPPMFFLSLLFLALVAVLITTQVYVPRLAELSALSTNATESHTVASLDSINQTTVAAQISPGIKQVNSSQITWWTSIFLLMLWPLFWIEHFYNARAACKVPQNKNYQKRMLAVCLCPPLRLGAPSPAKENKIWLPGLGWRESGRQLCKELQQKLSMPMLVIAMLILPVLLTEKLFSSAVADNGWLRIVLHTATGAVWIAFTAEFIVMVNASTKKIAYVKANWIDLAIILLPLISFLRSFSVLARLGRAYRMRGILIKTARALTLLEVADRLTGSNPAKKLDKLRDQYQEKTEELNELGKEIAFLEAEIAAS